jgi:hypothetical protein
MAIGGVVLALGVAVSPLGHAQAKGKSTQAHAKKGEEKHESAKAERKEEMHETFGGVAKKLNTTPAALEQAFTTAKQANPQLTRGQFLAANVVAANLGSKNPSITTDAILAGLKSGKSIGQTLQGLGLSKADADKAEDAARKEIRKAEAAADKAEKAGDKDEGKKSGDK